MEQALKLVLAHHQILLVDVELVLAHYQIEDRTTVVVDQRELVCGFVEVHQTEPMVWGLETKLHLCLEIVLLFQQKVLAVDIAPVLENVLTHFRETAEIPQTKLDVESGAPPALETGSVSFY